MRTGHILTLFGAILYVVAGLILPWQTFELAGVTAKSVDLSLVAQLAVIFAGAAAALSVFALLTGKRAVTARINVLLAFLLFGWLIYAKAASDFGLTLLEYEEISLELGFMLAVWAASFVLLGAMLTLATLPTWDESSASLRFVTYHKGELVGDTVIYEPGVVSVAQAHGHLINDTAVLEQLPYFRMTREGDPSLGFGSAAAGKPGDVRINQDQATVSNIVLKGRKSEGVSYRKFLFGDTGEIDLGDTKVAFHFVAPIPDRTAAPLLDKVELAAFALATTVILVALVAYPILTWTEEAVEPDWALVMQDEARCTGFTAKTQVEPEAIEIEFEEEDEPEPEDIDEFDEDVSKRAGGEEGTFGSPDIDPSIQSVVPLVDGRMAENLDVRQVGLNQLLTDNLGDMDAVAEVLRGDIGAMTSKLQYAMGGEGNDFVLGHGSGGMGFQGDGTGGGGDGAGRIMGMGDIDTGGGKGTRAGLGSKKKKAVKVALGTSQSSGFCQKSNLSSVVRRRAGAIRACYEQRLQVKTNLQGKVTVRWNIDLEGNVSSANATQDTLNDPQTTQCLLRTIRRMKFAKPEGGVCVVQWPFVFSPG